MTLDEFTGDTHPEPEPDPPVLARIDTLPVPVDALTDGHAGWPVDHNRPGIGYATPRERGDPPANPVHYFVIHEGYAVSDAVLDDVVRQPPPFTRVYVLETDTDTVYEWTSTAFLEGTPVDRDIAPEGQSAAACADAVHTWHGLAGGVWGAPGRGWDA